MDPTSGLKGYWSGSTGCTSPRPPQVGKAPCGLLKLKVCGVISGRLIPQETQVGCSENRSSSPPMTDTRTRPPPSEGVDSTESVTRWRKDGTITSGMTSP